MKKKKYISYKVCAKCVRRRINIANKKEKKRLTQSVLTTKKQNITLKKFVMFYYIDNVIFFSKML